MKSNPFDFTNRKNTGAKLGQIIADKLQKDAQKVIKDAEKKSAKGDRKSSIASSSSKVDAPEESHRIIDLQAPGKELRDEGTIAMADGLEAALKLGGKSTRLALVDINISGNDITTTSLARLAPIIKLAQHDLQTINLSDNAIQVATDDQARRWETFLLSFKDCEKLRRLDLSGNKELGSRALEIFARIHSREPPITALAADGSESVLSLPNSILDEISSPDWWPLQQGTERWQQACAEGLINESYGSPTASETDTVATKSSVQPPRKGLRSLPYLTLNNIGLDDAGSLWLSSILEEHHYPSQLIDLRNSSHPTSKIPAYQDQNSPGVDWKGNDGSLGKDGMELLRRTEAVRRAAFLEDADELGDFASNDHPSHGGVRGSGASMASGEEQPDPLATQRHRIQRGIIVGGGAKDVELWRAALNVIVQSRTLMALEPPTRALFVPSAADVTPSPPSTPSHKTTDAAFNAAMARPVPTASKPSTALPIRERKDSSRNTSKEYVKNQMKRIDAEGERSFREPANATFIPAAVAARIVVATLAEHELDVMGAKKTLEAVTWGLARNNLAVSHKDWAKHDRSVQVWMLLQRVGCLNYP